MRKNGMRAQTRAKYVAAIMDIVANPGLYNRTEFNNAHKISANLGTVLIRTGSVKVLKGKLHWDGDPPSEADLDALMNLVTEYETAFRKTPGSHRVHDTVQDIDQMEICEQAPEKAPSSRSFTLFGYTVTITRNQ